MKSIFETVAAAQKTSLEAAIGFTDSYLLVLERLTQLNIEVTHTAFEKSSEIALVCWEGCLAEQNPFGWNATVQSGIERFSEYCQNFRQEMQEASS